MKFPAIVLALMLLESVVALPTSPPVKVIGGKTVRNEPHDRTSNGADINVKSSTISTGGLGHAVTSAAKTTTANPTGHPASSGITTKQPKETSLSASDNTATSAEKSSTPTATSSQNPTEVAKAVGTSPQSRTSDQTLPKSVNPTAAPTQTTTQSRTRDQTLPKSVNPSAGRPQTTKQSTTHSGTSVQPLTKSENPTATTAQTTKPSVGSQSGSGKPKRAVEKSVEFARPPSTKAKAHLTNNHPSGAAARTQPGTNAKKSLPRTNAAFRAAGAASRKDVSSSEKSAANLPKTSEPSRREAPHSLAPSKPANLAKENRDGGATKVENTARSARAVVKPQLFPKLRDSREATTKPPTKTTPRPIFPKKDELRVTKDNEGVSKHKRPTRAALPPSTQAPHVNKEISTTTKRTVKSSEKSTGQLPTSVHGKGGNTDAESESKADLNTKAPTSISGVLSDMVKALMSTSEITKETEGSAVGNSNYSGALQSNAVKTTPPTTTTQIPIRTTSLTTRKPSYQADSSTGEARITQGLVEKSVISTVNHSTTSPVIDSSNVSQSAVEKSMTKSLTSSSTTHTPVVKSTEKPSTTIKTP